MIFAAPQLRHKHGTHSGSARQIIKENAKRDVRVEELEQKNTELEFRLTIVK